jgi:putative nucleotidyltransferase with HDIG domain
MSNSSRYPAYPVPAGAYRVSEKKNEILNAYLGTCVGLSLCDRKAKIGGLIHILLPEPGGSDYLGKPVNYAITGLPIFIKELHKLGSEISRLEATLAGGALVGDISKADMELDIGGRTVEVTERILRNAGISIIRRETGGFFSCRLSLNLDTFESTIHPIYNTPETVETDIIKPDQKTIRDAIGRIHSIPQMVFKILRMVRENRYCLQDLADEVRQDQVISAKLLRLCNSAFFGRRIIADSIDRVLVMLGEKQLMQTIMSVAFEDFYTGNIRGYSQCKGGLFNHAIGTAMICESLARKSQCAAPDTAYTAGLLHDIGKVVLDQHMGSAYPLFYRKTQIESEKLFVAERESFGITHDEVGEMLAEQWSLPESLTDAIKNHHNPENSSKDNVLSSVVYLADLIMSRFLVGQELERLDAEHVRKSLCNIGLNKLKFPNIIETIPPQIFQLPFEREAQSRYVN